jgi:hypothetical protein
MTMTTDLHHNPADTGPPQARNVGHGQLITPKEAEAIERRGARDPPHRVLPVTEALGYLGAVLALAVVSTCSPSGGLPRSALVRGHRRRYPVAFVGWLLRTA